MVCHQAADQPTSFHLDESYECFQGNMSYENPPSQFKFRRKGKVTVRKAIMQ
jgi:hypothetical protein